MRAAVLFLVCAPVCILAQKKPITLETLEEASRVAPQGPGNPVAWAPDGNKFLYRRGRTLVIYDPATQSSNSAAGRTSTRPSIFACCSPQSSAQRTGYEPSLVGFSFNVFGCPGMASRFPFSCGTVDRLRREGRHPDGNNKRQVHSAQVHR